MYDFNFLQLFCQVVWMTSAPPSGQKHKAQLQGGFIELSIVPA